MAGALRKTMEYLGLAEGDEAYDDYDRYVEEDRDTRRQPAAAPARAVREDEDERGGATVAQLPTRTSASQVVQQTEVGDLNRITTIHPRTYNEAKDIGEAFRSSIPVIMNLTDMDDKDAKRLVDFAAGLAFGLHGSIERVTSKVFLLSPEHISVEASGGEAPRTAQGPFNQS